MHDYKTAYEELAKKFADAQEQLRAYESDITKYRLAGDALNIGLWDMDVVNGDVTNPNNAFIWSQEIRTMLGFSDEQDFPNELGSWSSRLHPDDADGIIDVLKDHIEDASSKTPYDVEYRLQLKNGEYRYFHDIGTTLRDEEGTPIRMVGAIVDVTQKKLLEAATQSALEESSRTANTVTRIMNQSGAMVYVSDSETDEILFMTDSMKRHFGIEGDVIGAPCYTLLQSGAQSRCEACPWLKPDADKGMDAFLVSEEHNSMTKGYYRRVSRHISWPGERQARIQYLTDLTDVKLVQQTLEHQKTTLQTIIDSIPELVFCKDLKSRFTLLNVACLDFLNVSRESLVGKVPADSDFPANLKDALFLADRQVFEGAPKIVAREWLTGFDGNLRYFETTKAPLIQDGAIVGLVGVSRDITEANVRELELQKLHELNRLQLAKLDLAVKGAKIGLWDSDFLKEDLSSPETPFNWSDDIRNMLGFTDENDFPNVLDSWSRQVHHEDIDRVLDEFNRHVTDITGATAFDTEYRLKTKDGEYRYFRSAGETVRDERGAPERVAGMLIDITEIRQMTLALNDAVLESQKTIDIMSSILNNTDAMIYVSDKDTYELLFINNARKQHSGVGDEVVGQLCYQVFNEGKNEKCSWCPCEQLERDPLLPYTWEMRNNQTNRYYRNTDQYIDWPGGKTAHVQHSVELTDIRLMQEELSYNQSMLQAINSAAVVLLNADYASFKKNSQEGMRMMAEVLGIDRISLWKNHSEEEILYCTAVNYWVGSERAAVAPDTVLTLAYNEALPGWDEILARGECINSLVRDLPPRVQRQLADTGVLSVLIVPVFAEEKFWGFVGFDNCQFEKKFTKNEESILWSGSVLLVSAWIRSRMLASLHDSSVQLEKALEMARSADRSKGEFLRTVSHEIRTPMNAILGLTEIHLQSETLEADIREALDKIHVSGDMLLGIINDILDMSKIEAGKLEVAAEPYDTASLIGDTAHTNIVRRGSKPIEFNVSVAENMPAVLSGDQLRIKQILNNLLSNAFKYTEAGSVSLSFYAETGSESESDDGHTVMLVFEVSDTGQGMTEEEVSQIFELYTRFSLDTGQLISGTGLGMPIVKNLLELMNGEIRIESEPGKGSRFTVQIPQIRIGSSTLGPDQARSLNRFDTYRGRQLRRMQLSREPMPYGSVLIVDDVESNLYVAQGLIAPYGLRLDTARNGFEALEKIAKGNVYDVIFMDHMMPKLDGMATMKIMKEKGYENPIVVLTADAVIGQAEIFLQNGFDDFLSKPIDLRQLDSVLNRYVRDKYLAEKPELVKAAREQASSAIVPEPDWSATHESDGVQIPGPHVVEVFVRDATNAISALESLMAKREPWTYEDKLNHQTHVHGMKSALAIIGQQEKAAMALRLENAEFGVNMEALKSETTAFIDALRVLVQEFAAQKPSRIAPFDSEDEQYLLENLLVIKSASATFDSNTASRIVNELRKRSWSQPTDHFLLEIARHLLRSEFDEVVVAIDSYLKSNGK